MNIINDESAMNRSKARICSALMELLKMKPYRKISVSQICSSAGVSRTTFHKYFESMDDVVLYELILIEKNIIGSIPKKMMFVSTSSTCIP